MSSEEVTGTAGREAEMRSIAWLLRGASGSTEGVLELAGGRLSFIPTGVYQGAPLTRGDKRVGDEGPVFDAQLEQVTDVTFPWYYFSGGTKLTVDGERYRLSFVVPNNTRLSDDAGALDIPRGRSTGKAWKRILAERFA